jgi:hypothetical protein
MDPTVFSAYGRSRGPGNHKKGGANDCAPFECVGAPTARCPYACGPRQDGLRGPLDILLTAAVI